MRLRRPSPAMVVAVIALVVASAGGAYAAIKLPANSVKSKNIAPNAVKGVDVKEGSLQGVNADKLDGIDSGALVRSFGGHIGDTLPSDIFTVPELQASILGDTSVGSSANFRVRNNASSGQVIVSDLGDLAGTQFEVGPNDTSPNQNMQLRDGPLLLTSGADPDLMLIFGCAEGAGGAYCFGQLMRAPAG